MKSTTYLFLIENNIKALNNHIIKSISKDNRIIYYDKYLDTYISIIEKIRWGSFEIDITNGIIIWSSEITTPYFSIILNENIMIYKDISRLDPELKSWTNFKNFISEINTKLYLLGVDRTLDLEYILYNLNITGISIKNGGLTTFDDIELENPFIDLTTNTINNSLDRLFYNTKLEYQSNIDVIYNREVVNEYDNVVCLCKNRFASIFVTNSGKILHESIRNSSLLQFLENNNNNIKLAYCNNYCIFLIDYNDNVKIWHLENNFINYNHIDNISCDENIKIVEVGVTIGSAIILYDNGAIMTWGANVLGGKVEIDSDIIIRNIKCSLDTIMLIDENGFFNTYGQIDVDDCYPKVSPQIKKCIVINNHFIYQYLNTNDTGILPYYNISLPDEPNLLQDIVKVVYANGYYFLKKNGFVFYLDTNYYLKLVHKNIIDLISHNNSIILLDYNLNPIINSHTFSISVYKLYSNNKDIYGITTTYQLIKLDTNNYTCIQLSRPYKIDLLDNNIIVLNAGVLTYVMENSVYELNNKYYVDYLVFDDRLICIKNRGNRVETNIQSLDYSGKPLNLLNIKLEEKFYINSNYYYNVIVNNDIYLVLDHGIYLLNNLGIYVYINFFSVNSNQYRFLDNKFLCEYVNTSPYDIELELIDILELSPANTTVGFLITLDNNNDTKKYSYTILNNSRFYIEGNSLKLINGLSDVTAENFYYTLKIKSSDEYNFGYVKNFEFKLKIKKIDHIQTKISLDNVYFYSDTFIVSRLSITSNIFKDLANENKFRFSNFYPNDNSLFNIYNDKFIITNTKIDYTKKVEYNLCIEAINTHDNNTTTLVNPKIYRIYYNNNKYNYGEIFITNDIVKCNYNDLYIGTLLKIGNNDKFVNIEFKLLNYDTIFKIEGNILQFIDYNIELELDQYELDILADNFYNLKIIIIVKDRKTIIVDIIATELCYYDNSGINIVGTVEVLNIDNYNLGFSNIYEGVTIPNSNNLFNIINIDNNKYKIVANTNIKQDSVIILKLTKPLSASIIYKKLVVKYINDDNSIKLTSLKIIEGLSDNNISTISSGVKLIDEICGVSVSNDNKYFSIIEDNLVINIIPYISSYTEFNIILASNTYIKRVRVEILASINRPTKIIVDNLVLKYDNNYIGKLSIPNLDINNYTILLDNEYFSLIGDNLYRAKMLTNNLECNIYAEYKCDANLNYVEKFIFKYEEVETPNILYTNNENLLDIELSNNSFNDNNNIIGTLTTKSKIMFDNFIYVLDSHIYDNDLFKINNNILEFNTKASKSRYYISIKSFISSDNYIEKSFIIDKLTKIESKNDILSNTNIILTRNIILHNCGDNYLVGFVKCVYSKDNSYLLVDSDTEILDNKYFRLDGEELILLKSSNYFEKDRYKIRVCANLNYYRVFVIVVERPKLNITNYCNNNLDEYLPDNIITTSTIINKSTNLICYLYTTSCGSLISGYKYKLANTELFRVEDNKLVIDNEKLEYISNTHYRLTIITYHSNSNFYEKDVIFTVKDRYDFKVLLNKSVLKFPIDPKADIGFMIGRLTMDGVENKTIFGDENKWKYSIIGNSSYNVEDNVVYVKQRPLDSNFTILAKNRRIDHEFEVVTEIELEFIEGDIEIIDTSIEDHSIKTTSQSIYFNLIYKTRGLLLTMSQISDGCYVYYGGKSIDTNMSIDISKSSLFKFECDNVNKDYYIEFNLFDGVNIVNKFSLYICVYEKYYLEKILSFNKLIIHFSNKLMNRLEVKQYRLQIEKGIDIETCEFSDFIVAIKYQPRTKFLAKTSFCVYLLLQTYEIENSLYFYFDIIDNNGLTIVKNEIFSLSIYGNKLSNFNNLFLRRVSYVNETGNDYFYKKADKNKVIGANEFRFIFNTSINGLFNLVI
jgi:hypothetical protein